MKQELSERRFEKKPKILIVDDEPDIRSSLVELVSGAGFEPLSAATVAEAVHVIRGTGHQLALVLSDYSLGDSTGFDLRREMLGEFKHVPFVLMSGHLSREDAIAAVELKISAFVEKPFSGESLLKTLFAESKDRIAALRDEDELLSGFIGDARPLLEEMESLVMALDDSPHDSELLNRIFACAHTIKGSSGFFRPNTVHQFTHQFEDYFSSLKKSPEKITGQSISVLLQGLDIIRRLLSELETGIHESTDLKALLSVFRAAESLKEKEGGSLQEGPVSPTVVTVAKEAKELLVSLALINDFMEKSGEITVLRNMIGKMLQVIEAGNRTDESIANLAELLGEMHKVTSRMQDQLDELRKVPARQIVKPLQRTLRDLCVSLKKQIALEVEGSELRLEYSLADSLSKCLIHLVRNSADHGIELPSVRKACGKGPKGTIKLAFAEAPDEVTVKVEDDGGGIDPVRVSKKALENGLVTEAALSKMTDEEIRMLIFEPGFSTAEAVTDVSGRGVGADMVKSTVTAIGGRIQLRSEVGRGTTFELVLPIPRSVLIIESLMVRVGRGVFAIPREQIEQILRITPSEQNSKLKKIAETLLYEDGERILPVISLERVLGLPPMREAALHDVVELVVVKTRGGELCLKVDGILDLEEIVVKKIGKWLSKLEIYLGATFMGDGRIGLILDPEGIFNKLNLGMKRSVHSQSVDPKTRTSTKTDILLLFEAGGGSTFAVKLDVIYRLESIAPDQVFRSGKQWVCKYRDSSMPIFELSDLLGGLPRDGLTPAVRYLPGDHGGNAGSLLTEVSWDLGPTSATRVPLIVFESRGRYFSVVIEKIIDIAEADPESGDGLEIDTSARVILVQGKPATFLDLPALIKAL